MEASPQSYPASSRSRFRTPPLLPEDIAQPGIDLGAFVPSIRGNGSALCLKTTSQFTTAVAHSGRKGSAPAAARNGIDFIRPETLPA